MCVCALIHFIIFIHITRNKNLYIYGVHAAERVFVVAAAAACRRCLFIVLSWLLLCYLSSDSQQRVAAALRVALTSSSVALLLCRRRRLRAVDHHQHHANHPYWCKCTTDAEISFHPIFRVGIYASSSCSIYNTNTKFNIAIHIETFASEQRE